MGRMSWFMVVAVLWWWADGGGGHKLWWWSWLCCGCGFVNCGCGGVGCIVWWWADGGCVELVITVFFTIYYVLRSQFNGYHLS